MDLLKMKEENNVEELEILQQENKNQRNGTLSNHLT